ncbi:MAG: DNA-directed RNA polymerase [Nitrososphaerota archaeon]|nr:DNA-directed RNA polymerase [Nitrososphaerota archaeon]
MFQLVSLSDVVRIPPEKLNGPLTEVAEEILKARYESTLTPEFGYTILVSGVAVEPVGKLIQGDGGTYHRASFNVLAFEPRMQEIVEGEVVEITEFGAFVRIGPADALLHISQIMDDYISADLKQGVIVGTNTGRKIVVGSKVRVRITAVSLSRGVSMGKIGVTCRQPFLGALEWIKEDTAKASGQPAKKPADEGAEKPDA